MKSTRATILLSQSTYAWHVFLDFDFCCLAEYSSSTRGSASTKPQPQQPQATKQHFGAQIGHFDLMNSTANYGTRVGIRDTNVHNGFLPLSCHIWSRWLHIVTFHGKDEVEDGSAPRVLDVAEKDQSPE